MIKNKQYLSQIPEEDEENLLFSTDGIESLADLLPDESEIAMMRRSTTG
jgi:hypothetical protein